MCCKQSVETARTSRLALTCSEHVVQRRYSCHRKTDENRVSALSRERIRDATSCAKTSANYRRTQNGHIR